MKILNVMQCTNLGGMEQASLRLMIALTRLGHSCRVVSLNPLGGLRESLVASGIEAKGLTYAGRGGWRSFTNICRAVRSETADALLMTGHNVAAMLALGEVCRGHRVLCIHFHHEGVMPKWQWRLIYELALRKFDAVTFPSDFVRDEAVKICPTLREVGRTVRNPVALQQIPSRLEVAEARRKFDLDPGGWLVGNAGWLIRRKRFDVFLETAARIVAQRNDVRFVVAGDGPERSELEALRARLGLQDRVVFLGWRDDMQAFYQAIDVLLFNSDFDALGMTPIEAMAYGRPVVASVERGGLGEIIMGSAEVGAVLPRHDTDSLAEICINLLGEQGAVVGGRGRQVVERLCAPARIAREIEKLLGGGVTASVRGGL